MTMARLRSMTTVDGCPMDMVFISTQLWGFLGNHCLGDAVFSRRLQLVGGEGCNGLELWRYLFIRHKGGAAQVQLVDRAAFHDFP